MKILLSKQEIRLIKLDLIQEKKSRLVGQRHAVVL